ncbi:flagellin N-terminal helical domain-containing protein [Magnetospira thiophila]
MADVTLSDAVRSNLLSLQSTQGLIDRTQGRLSTGLKVAAPTDDAVKYFQAQSLSNRSQTLLERKSAVDQGVQALDATLKALKAVEDFSNQMKGLVDSARSADASQRAELQTQVQELAKQIEKLIADATYQGLNLLNSSSSKLSVRFSDKSDSKLEVTGIDINNSALYRNSLGTGFVGQTLDASQVNFVESFLGFGQSFEGYDLTDATELASFNAHADIAIARMDATISYLQAKAGSMANNIAILQVRSDFTQEYVDVLDTGAGKLTVADLNSEGANLLALQTRQQLGIQSLAFAGQAEQSILGLFR